MFKSIRYKLLFCFMGVALLSVPINIYLAINFNTVTQNFIYLTDYQLPRLQALLEMKNTALRASLFISNFNYSIEQIKGNTSTPTQLGATKDQLLAYLEEIGDWQKIYQQHVLPHEQSHETIKKLNDLKSHVILKALAVFAAKEEKLVEIKLQEKIKELEYAQIQLEYFINNQLTKDVVALDRSKAKTVNFLQLFKIITLLTSIALVFIACIIGFILSRWIAAPIILLRNFTYKINQDNLDLRIPILSKDEIGELGISINEMLEKLSQAKTQIMETSRLAGVAEVATNVIHNVGNILNSINTSISVLIEVNFESKLSSLSKLYQLISDNKNDLNKFINETKKGELVLPYFKQLIKILEDEHHHRQKELEFLRNNLDQVKQVITMQLSSKVSIGVIELFNVAEIIEGALQVNHHKIINYNINIIRNYNDPLNFYTVKSKLQQILVNLIKNAIEALNMSETVDKILSISSMIKKNQLQISITDNGIGILQEDLDRIFFFGFTTKKNGHGFGLHSCALLASELGGSLSVKSDGLQKGATFIIEIPNQE